MQAGILVCTSVLSELESWALAAEAAAAAALALAVVVVAVAAVAVAVALVVAGEDAVVLKTVDEMS